MIRWGWIALVWLCAATAYGATTSGSGTVTSITASGGLETATGSPVTTTGTIRVNICVNAQTGTSYTIVAADRGCIVTFDNAAAVSVTLPQAGTTGFDAGYYIYLANIGTGQVTVQPTTSTIQGAADLDLDPGRGTLIASDGANYVHVTGAGLTAEAQSIQSAFSFGKAITGADSEANCFRVGTLTQYYCWFHDASDGLMMKPQPLGDTLWRCWTGYKCGIRDQANGINLLEINPSAAGTPNEKYKFHATHRLLASFPVNLESHGGAVTMAPDQPVAGQAKAYWGKLTDSNSDGFSFHFPVIKRMEGATTLTVRLWGLSTAGSPSGNIVLDCAVKSYRPGVDTGEAHQTTNEQAVTLTPATQYREVSAVTPALTINGTVAEHAIINGVCEVNATGTTSAQLANFFLRGEAEIQLLVNSWSD